MPPVALKLSDASALYAGRHLRFGKGAGTEYAPGDLIRREDLETLSVRRVQQLLNQRQLRPTKHAVRIAPVCVFERAPAPPVAAPVPDAPPPYRPKHSVVRKPKSEAARPG